MRKDAVARRDRLIEVATTLFERDGYDIPLEIVIAAAGVGRGTLYRNFPDRTALMDAVLTYQVAGMEQFVAAHDDDSTLLETFVRRQGVLASLHAPAIHAVLADESRKASLMTLTARASALLEGVVARCHAAGTLRPDATAQHLRVATRMLTMTPTEPSGIQSGSLDIALNIVMRGLVPH